MSTTTQPMTAKRLAALPGDGNRYELVRGELYMMSPAGHEHGRVAMRLGSLLEQYVRTHQLGAVYAAETGFLIARDPDTVRAPDAAFLRHERLTGIADIEGYLPLAPDLVAEVVSPRDTFTEVERKALAWIEAGSSMVLVVDPGTRTVRIYRSKESITVLHEDDQLHADDVVPGWKFRVGELFE